MFGDLGLTAQRVLDVVIVGAALTFLFYMLAAIPHG